MLQVLESIEKISNPVICVENARRTGKTVALVLLAGRISKCLGETFVFLCENVTQRDECSTLFRLMNKNEKIHNPVFDDCLFLTKEEFAGFLAPDNGCFDYLVIDDFSPSNVNIPEKNNYKKIIVSRTGPEFKLFGLELSDI
jgi:hypothetical protein